MPYASKQDMIDRFGEAELLQITDRNAMGTIDDQVLAQAQLDGDAEIDAYLRPLYVLPLAEVPTNLVRLTCDIYRYYLYGNRVPEYAENRYKGAVDTLKLIMAGKMDLNPAHDAAPAPEPQVQVMADKPLFTRDTLKNF